MPARYTHPGVMPDRHLRDPSIMTQRSDPCRGRVLCAGSGGVAPLNPRLIAAIPSGMKMRPPSSEPGGFTECSRWLRSNATTPPVSTRITPASRRDASPPRMRAPPIDCNPTQVPLPRIQFLPTLRNRCFHPKLHFSSRSVPIPHTNEAEREPAKWLQVTGQSRGRTF